MPQKWTVARSISLYMLYINTQQVPSHWNAQFGFCCFLSVHIKKVSGKTGISTWKHRQHASFHKFSWNSSGYSVSRMLMFVWRAYRFVTAPDVLYAKHFRVWTVEAALIRNSHIRRSNISFCPILTALSCLLLYIHFHYECYSYIMFFLD